jgi:hypothetical protein
MTSSPLTFPTPPSAALSMRVISRDASSLRSICTVRLLADASVVGKKNALEWRMMADTLSS